MTLYDAANASGLQNGQPFPSLGSRDKPVQNVDGSTDLYLGPKAPDGKDSNWVPTSAGNGFEVLFRLYGPDKAFAEKTWKLPDIEKLQ